MGCRSRKDSQNIHRMATSRKHLETSTETHPGAYHRLQMKRNVLEDVRRTIPGTGWMGIFPGPGEHVCNRPGCLPSGPPRSLPGPSPRRRPGNNIAKTSSPGVKANSQASRDPRLQITQMTPTTQPHPVQLQPGRKPGAAGFPNLLGGTYCLHVCTSAIETISLAGPSVRRGSLAQNSYPTLQDSWMAAPDASCPRTLLEDCSQPWAQALALDWDAVHVMRLALALPIAGSHGETMLTRCGGWQMQADKTQHTHGTLHAKGDKA